MKRKEYKTTINAPREIVWETLWGKETYPKWTSAFAEGSQVKTDWQEGGKVLFVNGENEGMISRIEEKRENEKMVFEHLGMIDKDGNEDFSLKDWAGAKEIYTLTSRDGKTDLLVELDLAEGHEAYFDNSWPKAFEQLKQLAEK